MTQQKIHIPFDIELPPYKILKTRKLSCLYEEGKLRYIKCGRSELIRTIYFAVRNENWDTAAYTIENEKIEESENSFCVSYTSLHQLNDIHYRAEIEIKAEDNSISFSVRGEALSSFKKNRIGICVLHPIEGFAAQEVQITRPDGTIYAANFSELISPHQPFKDMASMRYRAANGVATELTFEGDIFETEDQRNWADATYKTYSTPLDIPFPVEVQKGEAIDQRVTLTVSNDMHSAETNSDVQPKKTAFPKLGYSRKKGESLHDKEIDLLRQIPFDHYRVELFLFDPNWRSDFEEALIEASKLRTKLELILFFKDDYTKQLQDFINAIKTDYTLIESILVLGEGQQITPVGLIRSVYNEVKTKYPQISVGYGTDGFFADLNRNRPANIDFDFVSFSANPQVHASDTRSIIENVERLDDLVQTAKSFSRDKNIHISPITFKMRSGLPENEEDYDPRQDTAFGAFWTLVAMKNLSAASKLTLFQVKGYRGILKKQPTPLFKLLRTIKDFNPKWIIFKDPSSTGFYEPVILENEEGEQLEFVIDKDLSEAFN